MKKLIPLAVSALAFCAPGVVHAEDRVTFATNWLAQGEHGGFYQALADGTYAAYGLDVTIRPGGPQSSGRQLLIAGQVEFYMGGMATIDAAAEAIPVAAVAAMFQKDPQVLLAHPDAPFETLADLAGASRLILSQVNFFSGFYPWIKANFEGFSDEKFEPYTFSPAPFLADPLAVQQGFVTSEPYAIRREAGWEPKIFLLADYGYSPYSTTIETRHELIETNPDLVQRFVDASIVGWYNYLYGDNSAANALIKADNPEMTDGQLAHSLEKMREYEVAVAGDAAEFGIGCMSAERWRGFYEDMVEIGIYAPGIPIENAFTTQFVCKGVGLELMD